MRVVVASDDKQGTVVHQAIGLCFFEELFESVVYPIDSSYSHKFIITYRLRHIFPLQAIVRIWLVHVKSFGNHEHFVVAPALQHFNSLFIHYIIVEAPAAGTGIPLFFQILTGIVFLHAKLLRILLKLIGIITTGRI
ncbi:hypothetical protein SDC9_152279 [bioreactor metagenome]|uniref:Uncharacterized protein n=1 Tax=bioreactor metagenome TaxID=1076179 RepID=A0A645EUB1_9ZZZZ